MTAGGVGTSVSTAGAPTAPNIEVLDASAMLAFLRREKGYEVVRELLTDPATVCHAHAVNMAEVAYLTHRRRGPAGVSAVVAALTPIVTFYNDSPDALWLDVARLKATYSKAGQPVSLADCFLVALARHLGGRVVTSDHTELDALEAAREAPFLFFR